MNYIQVSKFICLTISVLLLSSCGSQKKQTAATKKFTQKQATEVKPVEKKETKIQLVNKNIKEMTFDELKAKKTDLLAKDNKENAVKYLEKMVALCTDIDELKIATLELADIHFDLGNLDKAAKLYEEFSNLYPGDEKVEYADYRSVMCNFYLVLSKDRDQTKTKKTVELTKKFLGRTLYHVHVDDVKNIHQQCAELLTESEFNIIDFYLQRGSSKSVRSRLANLEKEFVPTMPELKSRMLLVECRLAELENDVETLAQKKSELAAKYPEVALANKNVSLNNVQGKKATERF
jgi:outer membrane assembly lipoprotein YfiO